MGALGDIWWVWVAGGLALAVVELIAPGFFFVGFAIGAVVTGILVLLGLLDGGNTVSLLAFSVISVIAWVALRKLVGVRKGQKKIWDRDINEN